MSWWVCTQMSARDGLLKCRGSKLPCGLHSQGHDCLARELDWESNLCSWILWWNFGCGVILTKNFGLCSAGCPDYKCLALSSFYKWKLGMKEIMLKSLWIGKITSQKTRTHHCKAFFFLIIITENFCKYIKNIFLNLVPEFPYKSLHGNSEDYTI